MARFWFKKLKRASKLMNFLLKKMNRLYNLSFLSNNFLFQFFKNSKTLFQTWFIIKKLKFELLFTFVINFNIHLIRK